MEESSFFFEAPDVYDEATVKKRWKEDSAEQMTKLAALLGEQSSWDAESLEEHVKSWIEAENYGMGKIMNAFRLALVGESKGPHMFDIAALLGREETLRRLQRAVEILG